MDKLEKIRRWMAPTPDLILYFSIFSNFIFLCTQSWDKGNIVIDMNYFMSTIS